MDTLTHYQQAQRLITGVIDAVLPRLSEAMTAKVRAIRGCVEAGDDYGAEDVTYEIDEIMSGEPERLTTWDVAVHSWLSAMVERTKYIREDNEGVVSGIEPIGGGSQLDFLRRLVAEAQGALHISEPPR